MNIDLLGKGPAYPLHTTPAGSLAVAGQADKIKESIRIILGTQPGERLMRPTFGCNLKRLLWAPNSGATANLAQHYVEEALRTWEPRIILEAVEATSDAANGRLLIEVHYRIKTTYEQQSLVYPFYVQPR